jgi:hypothetical protein
MFQNLRHPFDSALFRQLAHKFLDRQEQHQALLCFDHYFINFPSTVEATNTAIAVILNDFWNYCRLFRELVQSLDVADEAIQKLFNFQPASIENAYRLKNSTWVYRVVMEANPRILESDEEFMVIPGDELQLHIKARLWDRLAKRLVDENERCHQRIAVAAFCPCLPFVVNNWCGRTLCPRQHIDYQDLSPAWFNTQVRIHFLQILIYQVYHCIPVVKPNTISERRCDLFPCLPDR